MQILTSHDILRRLVLIEALAAKEAAHGGRLDLLGIELLNTRKMVERDLTMGMKILPEERLAVLEALHTVA